MKTITIRFKYNGRYHKATKEIPDGICAGPELIPFFEEYCKKKGINPKRATYKSFTTSDWHFWAGFSYLIKN